MRSFPLRLLDLSKIISHSYYLPIFFQSVKDSDAQRSGLYFLAYQLSNAVASIVSGVLIGIVGWYAPFAWVGSIIFIVGSGLLYTVEVNSTLATLIGFQILTGAGVGSCGNVPYIATQVVASRSDMSSASKSSLLPSIVSLMMLTEEISQMP